MDKKERDNIFWKQYRGEVLAIDLPQEYIEQDTRIYCVNEKCFVKNKCELFLRYECLCKVFGGKVVRACIEDAKGRWKRNPWERAENDVNYMQASFGMNPLQIGAEPCEHFIKTT